VPLTIYINNTAIGGPAALEFNAPRLAQGAVVTFRPVAGAAEAVFSTGQGCSVPYAVSYEFQNARFANLFGCVSTQLGSALAFTDSVVAPPPPSGLPYPGPVIIVKGGKFTATNTRFASMTTTPSEGGPRPRAWRPAAGWAPGSRAARAPSKPARLPSRVPPPHTHTHRPPPSPRPLPAATEPGGAVFLTDGATGKISGCTFESLQTGQGAAIAVTSAAGKGVTTLEVCGLWGGRPRASRGGQHRCHGRPGQRPRARGPPPGQRPPFAAPNPWPRPRARRAQVTDTTFKNCVATETTAFAAAGAVLLKGASGADVVKANLTRCTFTGNTASATPGGGGGAVAVGFDGDELVATDCTFENNRAKYGGAIVAAASTKVTVSGGAFRGNGLASGATGSALYFLCVTRAAVSGAAFQGFLQARSTLSSICSAAPAAPVIAVDRCSFDSAPLPGESVLLSYFGTSHVIVNGPTTTATITRSAFLNADPSGSFRSVTALVGAAGARGRGAAEAAARGQRRACFEPHRARAAGGVPPLTALSRPAALRSQAGADVSVRQCVFANNRGVGSATSTNALAALDRGTRLAVKSCTLIGNKNLDGARSGTSLYCYGGAPPLSLRPALASRARGGGGGEGGLGRGGGPGARRSRREPAACPAPTHPRPRPALRHGQARRAASTAASRGTATPATRRRRACSQTRAATPLPGRPPP
jgi:predicted outer membrane repeat protein